METIGLYVGRNGIEMPVLAERTGVRFERIERGSLLPSLRDSDPGIVLVADEDAAMLALDIGAVRLVSDVPLLALVREGESAIGALHAGADSIAPAPANLEEVALKIEMLLHRCGEAGFGASYADAELELDRFAQQVRVHGEEIELTPTELRMLSALVDRRGAVLGHLELRDRVWGDSFHDRAEVKLYVSYLRRKFAAAGVDPIETVRGIGYRYCPRPIVLKAEPPQRR